MTQVKSIQLNCLDFLVNQVIHSKNGSQPQLIRYDTNIDADAPSQSLPLSVNRPYPVVSVELTIFQQAG